MVNLIDSVSPGKIEGTRQFLHPINNLVRLRANGGKIKHTCMMWIQGFISDHVVGLVEL